MFEKSMSFDSSSDESWLLWQVEHDLARRSTQTIGVDWEI